MTLVLTVNPGSSGLRLHLVQSERNRIVAACTTEHRAGGSAVGRVLKNLLARTKQRVDAVGHRLVHGGPHLRTPTVVTDDAIERTGETAEGRRPVTLELLDIVRTQLPDVPHVLCPDSAFHATLAESSAIYAIPAERREDFGLCRYGSHGLSYTWAADRAALLLGKPSNTLNLLLAHLGGVDCSVCAVRAGRSVDTSSGLYDRSGAPAVFTRRISQGLAAMAVNLSSLDALVFTGEIGWDRPEVRQAVCLDLTRLGVPAVLPGNDPELDSMISSPYAPVPVLAVQPREELQIASEVRKTLVRGRAGHEGSPRVTVRGS
ncbi:MAG: acetate kinase [Kibdelosporangium sp.]